MAHAKAPVITGSAKINVPDRPVKRGNPSLYPFDTLTEPGMAFGVKGKTAKQLGSIVSNANRKHRSKSVVDGKEIVTEHQKFFAFEPTAEQAKEYKGTKLEGASVVVVREK